MRRFYPIMFGAAAVVLIACAEKSDSTAPISRKPVPLASSECRTGFVIHTGADGTRDSTCADGQ